MRSTDKNPNNEVNQSSSNISAEIVEALQDDRELIVDGFQRFSVLGLEVAMMDGPLKVRTTRPKTELRNDDPRGQPQ